MAKKQTEKKPQDNLEKFAIFFEQQNSKARAKKMMWAGVTVIFVGILIFVIYATKLQIGAFTWDQATLKVKDSMEKQWEDSFAMQEKEKNISNIKKQMIGLLQEINSSTIAVTTTASSTITTSTITDTTTVSSTLKK
jgi:hypothetical protein